MRARRIALWSALGLLSLLTIAGTWLWTADLGTFKPQLERWVSNKTGRSFSIAGDFRIDLGKQSVIIAEGIRFGNAGWADAPEMLEVGHFEVRVNTWSLFSGPIEIEFIGLNDARLRLTQPAAGDPNWTLPLARSPEKTKSSGPGFLIREIDVSGVHLSYDSPERSGPLDLRVSTLHQRHRADETLEVDVAATLNDRTVNLRGIIGTWDALLAQKDISYELEGQLDSLQITSKGQIDDLLRPRRPTLEFALQGPDINDIARLLRITEGVAGSIDLTGTLAAADEQSPLQIAVAGRVGQSAVDIVGLVSDFRDVENGSVKLRASGPDLSRILKLFGVHNIPDAPFDIEVDLERRGALLTVDRAHLLFANAEFDLQGHLPEFPGLNDGKAHLRIAGPDFEHFREMMKLPGSAEGAFLLDFDLDVSPDGVDIVQLGIETSLARLEAQGHLGDAPDYIGSEVRFKFAVTNLGGLLTSYGIAGMPEVPTTLEGAISIGTDGVRINKPLTLQLEGNGATLGGLITMKPGLVGSDLSFGLHGPDLAELLGSFATVGGVPALAYDLAGKVQIQNGAYRFRDTRGTLGRSNLAFSGLLRPTKELTGTDIRFEIDGPALEELLDHVDDIQLHPGAYSLSGGVSVQADTFKLSNVAIVRPRGKINLGLEVGRSGPRRSAKFDLKAGGRDFRSMLGKVIDFEFNEAPFTLSAIGELGPASLSLDTFDLAVGDMTVTARGDLHLERNAPTTQFSTKVRVPSLARLGLFRGSRFRDQRLELDATVHGGGGALAVDNFRALAGSNEVQGSLRYTNSDRPELEIDLRSESIVASPWLEETEAPAKPQTAATDGRLIPDFVIPYAQMNRINAAVKLDLGELRRGALHFSNITLQATLQGGILRMQSAKFQGNSGWIQARAEIVAQDGNGQAKLEVAAREVTVGDPESAEGFGGRADIDINLASDGADLRTLAGNTNGIVLLHVYDAHSKNSELLDKIFGDVLNEIVSTINPFSRTDPLTRYECGIFPFEITSGALAATPNSFIRTDKIQIVSAMTLDLKSENITANIRTAPRKGVSISAGQILNPFIKVIGTLAEPRLAVDEQGVLVSGGVAVATGGLSLLAKVAWDRLSRSSHPCEDLQQEVAEAFDGRLPEFSAPSIQ